MTTIAVTHRALIQRINRRLLKEQKELGTSRYNVKAFKDLGRYYIVDLKQNAVTQTNIDIEDLGRVMGLLKPYERLEAL